MGGYTDVPSPGGWLKTYGLRVASAIVIGTVGLAAGAQIYGGVDFKSVPGTSTGAYLQVDGVTRYHTAPVTCTATGGLTKYSTCAARSPFTTTGALLGVSLECGNVARSLAGDVSFKKTIFSNTGTVLTNLDNVALGSGANVNAAFAVPVNWNPADLLTFSTLTTPDGTLNTTRYNCQMWAVSRDKYGS